MSRSFFSSVFLIAHASVVGVKELHRHMAGV